MKDLVKQLFVFGAVVLVLAACLGFVDSRWLEPARVPPCDPAKLPEGRICLATVLADWNERVVWVDARGEDAYERGTIRASDVYPIRNDAKGPDLLAEAMPALFQAGIDGKCIVIFCDRHCTSSTDIAAILREYQLDAPIFILEGGWDEISKIPSLKP